MRILHPTDFSESAARAEGRAVELARKLGAELVLVLLPVTVTLPALYQKAAWGSPTLPP
jgi:nucleotide-binding universal stress UspA family protein